jgi:phytoene dehydrogenase-like protein
VTERVDVAVVGAGAAGLACARRLDEAGLDVLVLEAADAVGGRLRTDIVEGFVLDRGVHVLPSGYPEAARLLGLPGLDLPEVYPGALVRYAGRLHRVADPFRRPVDGLAGLRGATGRLRDYPALGKLRGRARSSSVESLLSRRETTVRDALASSGLSERLMERVLAPLFSALFLDRELETSSRMLEFAVRMLSLGHAVLPPEGIEWVARELAGGLPQGSIRVGAPVESVDAESVALASGERLGARAVVVATDGTEASRLLAEIPAPSWRSVTCVYFAAPSTPFAGAPLLLDGERTGPVASVFLPSTVAPSRAPEGRVLVAVTVLGLPDGEIEQDVADQLRGWLGDTVDAWRHLRTCRIERAAPSCTPPCLEPASRAVRLPSGLLVCGDHRETPTLEGAFVSARRAAQAAIESLRR